MAKQLTIISQEELDEIREELANLKHFISDRFDAVEKHNDDGLLLTSAQAARKLHVTTRTLLKWRKAGIVQVSQVGRRIYYRKSDIDQLIENNRIDHI